MKFYFRYVEDLRKVVLTAELFDQLMKMIYLYSNQYVPAGIIIYCRLIFTLHRRSKYPLLDHELRACLNNPPIIMRFGDFVTNYILLVFLNCLQQQFIRSFEKPLIV